MNIAEDYAVNVEPCRKAGLETIRLSKHDRSVYLHSKYDPEAEAVKLTEKLDVGIDTVYFIFGLGAGYHVRVLLKRMGAENKMVVFEPNNAVYEIFVNNENNGGLFLDERIIFERYISVPHVRTVLEQFYKSTVSNMKNSFFALPVYKDIYPNEYDGFMSCIKSMAEMVKLISNTHKVFSDIWFKCLINNMSFLRRSYSGKPLEGMYTGIPAIIVSAGPSLAKNIGLISEVFGKAVIISVDTAYKPLYNKGIMPDFVVSVDSGKYVAAKFQGIETPAADLVSPYLSATEMQAAHKGRIIALSDFHVFLDKCYEDLGIELLYVKTGGSVACTALDLAYKMGAEPIIFIGQDLAFTNNKSHIEGSAYYKEGITATGKEIFTLDINGSFVQTDYNLKSYKEWIEQYIADNNDRTYIDATEGGAKINGTAIMTLKETIDKCCSGCYEISERKELIFVPENKSATGEQYKGFIEHFEKSCKYLEKIVYEIDDCIPIIEKMIKEINLNGFKRPERITAQFEKVKRLNKSLDINEHYVDIILALMARDRDEATRTDHLQGNTEEQALAGDLERHLNYFKALSQNIKYAVPLIEDAVQKEKKYMEGF